MASPVRALFSALLVTGSTACFVDAVGEGSAGGGGAASSQATTAPTSTSASGTTETSASTGATTSTDASSSSVGPTTAASTSTGTTPACGDGTVDQGETCDDMNTVTGDGCSSDCQDEDHCPGASFDVSVNAPVTINGNTQNTDDDGESDECGEFGSLSGDLVYAFTAAHPGTMVVAYAAAYDAHVYVRSSCGDDDSEIDCSSDNTGSLSFSVQQGETVYVFMDGFAGAHGGFSLTVALSPI